MRIDLYSLIGFVGAAMIIMAYFANQQDWLDTHSLPYLLANLLGGGLILVSLTAAWNFPSVIIEAFWVAISAYGLIRRASANRARLRRTASPAPAPPPRP